jgi:hypothetical protein
MLPVCCLPLWEREGVTLLAAAENKRITGKEDFNRAKIYYYFALRATLIIPFLQVAMFYTYPGLWTDSMIFFSSFGRHEIRQIF